MGIYKPSPSPRELSFFLIHSQHVWLLVDKGSCLLPLVLPGLGYGHEYAFLMGGLGCCIYISPLSVDIIIFHSHLASTTSSSVNDPFSQAI